MIKNNESANVAGKETIDACMQTSNVLVRGCQEIGNHFWTLAQNAIDINAEHVKILATIKSPQQWLELQTKWASRLFEAAQSGSAKLSELSTKITSEAATPMQSHFYGAASKMAEHMANISDKAA